MRRFPFPPVFPFPEFSENWDDEWRNKYEALIARADHVKVISAAFSEDSYQLRNQWMVCLSSKVIAVYNGKVGGTRNTINYARKKHVFIRYIKG